MAAIIAAPDPTRPPRRAVRAPPAAVGAGRRPAVPLVPVLSSRAMTIEIRTIRGDELADVRRHPVDRVPRPPQGRGTDRRGAAPALGPGPRVGGLRRGPPVRHVPLVGDRDDRPGRPPPAGVRDRRRHGPAHPPSARDPAPMTAAEHAAIRRRGEAFALLHAAEWPIYGRFGYGPATQEATWTLDTRDATFVGEPVGRVVLAPPDAVTRDIARTVFESGVSARRWASAAASSVGHRLRPGRELLGRGLEGIRRPARGPRWGHRWLCPVRPQGRPMGGPPATERAARRRARRR